MKKSYTDKKRTTIALDPELTRRIEKMLKNSGKKLSKYTQEAIKKELENDERDKTIKKWEKLMDSSQYQRIKQLEGEVKKLKEDHISAKDIEVIKMNIEKFTIDVEEDMKKQLSKTQKKIEAMGHALLKSTKLDKKRKHTHRV